MLCREIIAVCSDIHAKHRNILYRQNASFFYRWTRWCMGTAVAQWLRCCTTNRKVASSTPAGAIVILINIKSFRSRYGSGVDSASNRNEYQEYFLGVKVAGA